MRALSHPISVFVCGFEELDEQEQALLLVAADAMTKAQAPYSHYLVGAAVLDGDGHITAGCNVERCTYTQTTHAEQAAVDAMVVHGKSRKIQAVAVVGGPDGTINGPIERFPKGEVVASFDEIPAPSCGHCLQIIWENCRGDNKVKLYSWADGWVYITTIGDALPMKFGPNDLL